MSQRSILVIHFCYFHLLAHHCDRTKHWRILTILRTKILRLYQGRLVFGVAEDLVISKTSVSSFSNLYGLPGHCLG